MNLEQIDTSTTAGKAEVMRLAAEGRKCFSKFKKADYVIDIIDSQTHEFDWSSFDYVVTVKSELPDEVWVSRFCGKIYAADSRDSAERFACDTGCSPVRYIRADLAGEGK